MKKFLHQAGGIARRVTAAAVKLAKKLAHMAAEAAVSAVAAVGKAATKAAAPWPCAARQC